VGVGIRLVGIPEDDVGTVLSSTTCDVEAHLVVRNRCDAGPD